MKSLLILWQEFYLFERLCEAMNFDDIHTCNLYLASGRKNRLLKAKAVRLLCSLLEPIHAANLSGKTDFADCDEIRR
jgi:hypothetical protein